MSRRPSSTRLPSRPNSGPRWSIVGRSIARRIRSGTLVGPGICRKCRPECRPFGALMIRILPRVDAQRAQLLREVYVGARGGPTQAHSGGAPVRSRHFTAKPMNERFFVILCKDFACAAGSAGDSLKLVHIDNLELSVFRPGTGSVRGRQAGRSNRGTRLMKVFTIGFTRKSAGRFFGLLRKSGAKRIVDVRLNNVSQLAGFAKRDDLAYFLTEICGMQYVHLPVLAPTKEMLDDYKKRRGDWETYEARFPRPHARAADREDDPEGNLRGRLPAVQRRSAPPLPPPSGGGVSERSLGWCRDRSPRIEHRRR